MATLFEPPPWQTAVFGIKCISYYTGDDKPKCAYCGHKDNADRYGNCNGCGAPI